MVDEAGGRWPAVPGARTLRRLLTWPVESQQGSCRNALVASTAMAQRRRERDEVERFLAARTSAAAPTRGGRSRSPARRAGVI